MNYLFDFQSFLDELRENPEKKSIVENFETWAKDGSLEEQEFYQHYLCQLTPFDYSIPEELKEDFDWELLSRLIFGSFSSSYALQYQNNIDKPELVITVSSGSQSVTKTESELWSFQVLWLYEIFVEEQLNLESLRLSDPNEAEAIEKERIVKLSEFKHKVKILNIERLKREREKILNS